MEQLFISDLRRRQRVTRKQLAAAVGVTPYRIQQIEWGAKVEPQLAERIASALGVGGEQLTKP
jgi:DNA-binding XRE family transcriptional regulator